MNQIVALVKQAFLFDHPIWLAGYKMENYGRGVRCVIGYCISGLLDHFLDTFWIVFAEVAKFLVVLALTYALAIGIFHMWEQYMPPPPPPVTPRRSSKQGVGATPGTIGGGSVSASSKYPYVVEIPDTFSNDSVIRASKRTSKGKEERLSNQITNESGPSRAASEVKSPRPSTDSKRTSQVSGGNRTSGELQTEKRRSSEGERRNTADGEKRTTERISQGIKRETEVKDSKDSLYEEQSTEVLANNLRKSKDNA